MDGERERERARLLEASTAAMLVAVIRHPPSRHGVRRSSDFGRGGMDGVEVIG